MNTKHLFCLSLISISLLSIAVAEETNSVFDEPAASIRIPGKKQPAPIDLWVEGQITKVDQNAGTFSVQGRRMTFIHAYDMTESAACAGPDSSLIGWGYYDAYTGEPVEMDSQAAAPSACGCNEIIVRSAGQTENRPTPSSEVRELPIGQGPVGNLTVLDESDFVGRTNLHQNNQLAPIGRVDDPVNCACDQTILTPRSGAAFGSQRASNEKTQEEVQNVSYEKNGLSYDMTAAPARSLKNLKAGDHVMVGFAVNDNGNVAYMIIRQAQ